MDYLGPVLVVYVDARCSEQSFERQLTELAGAIDERDGRAGVLYDVPSMRTLDARRRRAFTAMFEAHEERLAQTTAAYVLVTSSPVARGILRAMFWVAPPPYPHRVVSTTREGFAYLASEMPGLQGDLLEREYATLLRRHSVCLRDHRLTG